MWEIPQDINSYSDLNELCHISQSLGGVHDKVAKTDQMQCLLVCGTEHSLKLADYKCRQSSLVVACFCCVLATQQGAIPCRLLICPLVWKKLLNFNINTVSPQTCQPVSTAKLTSPLHMSLSLLRNLMNWFLITHLNLLSLVHFWWTRMRDVLLLFLVQMEWP